VGAIFSPFNLHTMTDKQYLYIAKLLAKDFNCEIHSAPTDLGIKKFSVVCYSRSARGETLATSETAKELFEFLIGWVGE